MSLTEFNKLKNGEKYFLLDPEIGKIQIKAMELCQEYNKLPITAYDKKEKLIRKLFGSCGKNTIIKPGFLCDMGINIHIGDDFIANYNVTILDMASVNIGNNVWFGPNVSIYAISHPLEPQGRLDILGMAKPINICDNVWIGGNSTVLKGVTIGKNAVIGAGSLVNKDIPDNALAIGSPAKVVKYIK